MENIGQIKTTYVFLDLPKSRNCDGNITARSFNVLRCRSRWPLGKVFLVERGEELAKRLGSVVRPIDLVLRHEPIYLFKRTR